MGKSLKDENKSNAQINLDTVDKTIIEILKPVYDKTFDYRDLAFPKQPDELKKPPDTLCLLTALILLYPGDLFSKHNITPEIVFSKRLEFNEVPGMIKDITDTAAMNSKYALQNFKEYPETVVFNNLILALLKEKNSHAYKVLKSLDSFQIIKNELILSGTVQSRPAGVKREPGKTLMPEKVMINQKQNVNEKKESALEAFGRDLTLLAKNNKLDPVIGREKETELIINTLLKRKKNNVVIVGEAGVGKTALAESVAQKIATGNVPEILKNKSVVALDMTALTAGTGFRGALEERVKLLMEEIIAAGNIILFIDELHNIVGSGASDMANLLKPALSREGFQCIGATTYDEYRRFIEKDAALERRFQPVTVEEPSEEETILILKGIISKYQDYHKTKYSDKVIEEAVKLTTRYITYRNQPDKSIDLIDAAGVLARDSEVTREHLIKIIELWTGVKVIDEDEDVLERLTSIVIGQDHICKAVIDKIFGIHDLRSPRGKFMFLGPTGVGKTYLAEKIANVLRYNFIKLNMQNFQQSFQASSFLGAPPGYVGYDDGSKFVENIRHHPQSVVLFDEMEKAHPDIHDHLLSILDGEITDARGRLINFKNAIIILTSNLPIDPKGDLTKQLLIFLRPEFINRIDGIFILNKLSKEDIKKIIQLELQELESCLRNPKIKLDIAEPVINFLTDKGFDEESGARAAERAINNELSNKLSAYVRENKLTDGNIIKVSLEDGLIHFSKVENLS